jgi:CBS domain-containing protein
VLIARSWLHGLATTPRRMKEDPVYAVGTQPTRPSDPVGRIMMWPVATVSPEATLLEVAGALAADEIGAVLVLQGGNVVGVLSERDITNHLAAGSETGHLTAADVMSTDVVSVDTRDTVLDVATQMRDAGVRHLPVFEDGRIAGVVSMRDLFGVLLDACADQSDVVVVPSGTRIVVRAQ